MLTPFFSRELDTFVVGEMCKCGHPKSTHGSVNTTHEGHIIRVEQEGNCCEGHCECPRFTWSRWITETEACEVVRNKVPVKLAS